MDRATFTKQEVAAYLGVTTRTISTLVKDGNFPHIKISDTKQSKIVFPKEAVDRWISERVAKSLHPSNRPAPDVVRRRRRVN